MRTTKSAMFGLPPLVDDVMAVAARTDQLSDLSNQDLLNEVHRLLSERKAKKRRSQPDDGGFKLTVENGLGVDAPSRSVARKRIVERLREMGLDV